jgi:hypothetical protein
VIDQVAAIALGLGIAFAVGCAVGRQWSKTRG